MSVWSTLEGTVIVPKNCRKGVRDVIKKEFHGMDYGVGFCDELTKNPKLESRTFQFMVSICEDGISAAQVTNNLLNTMKDYGMYNIDVSATIRFLK